MAEPESLSSMIRGGGASSIEEVEDIEEPAPEPKLSSAIRGASRVESPEPESDFLSPRIYNEEIAAAKEELGKPGFLPKLSGVLRYGFAPIRTLSRAFVGDPIERVTGSETAGEIGNIAAELFTPGIGLTRLPGAVERAGTAARLAATKRLPEAPQATGGRGVSEVAPEVAAGPAATKRTPPAVATRIPEGAASPQVPAQETPRLSSLIRDPAHPQATRIPEGAPVSTPKRNAAGNINLDYISEPKHIQDVISETAKAIPLERVSNAETIRAAQELGLTERQLLGRRGQQALNPQQIIAARDILIDSSRRVSELAPAAVGGGDDAVLAFKQAIDRHTAIQSQVSGATALAGRALQSFRINVQTPRDIKRALDELGGKAGIEEMAQAVADLKDLEKASRFLQAATLNKGGWMGRRRGMMEYWVNSILSGPKTHAANIIGNSFTTLLQIPEESVAAGLQATRAFGKGGEKLTQRGVGERAYGMLSGVNDALRAAGTALRREGVDTALSKVEHQPAIPGKIGKVVRMPGRLLGAEDEFFKTINYRGELRSQAANLAKSEGVKGPALSWRIAELLDNPTSDMLTAATRHAEEQTFTKAGGPVVRWLQDGKSKVPEFGFIVPFVRTPANLVKYAIARTPAAALMPSTWAQWKSGSAGKARVTSRVLTGAALQAWFYSLAKDGFITGHGPESRPQRESLKASGWRPYSVKVGDEYVSYQRGDPLSTLVGMMADAQSLTDAKSKSDLTGATLATLTENLADKTFFKGITDFAMTIEYKNPEYIAKQIGAGFIPTALNQIRQSVDPVYRETELVADALMNRVPGLSSRLEPQRDVLGEPIAIDEALGPDALSPIAVSRESKDPVRKLLGEGISVGKPARRVQGKGLPRGGVELSGEEYAWLLRRSGETAKAQLDRVVNSRAFQGLDREQQQAAVNRIFDRARTPLREQLKESRRSRP